MTMNLSALGWGDDLVRAYARFVRPDHRPARVARVDRGVCTVLGLDGPVRTSVGGGLLAAAAQDPVRLPCAGDWVVLREWPDRITTIEAVLPRRTALVRAGAGAQATGQILASNVDSVAVVAAVDPEPDLVRIERLLAVAWQSGARPLVVLTKVDLAADPAALADQVADVAGGAEVHPVSAPNGIGLESLRPHVGPGRTLGLLGTSGSGKSTLVNALAGATVMGTQEIRRADGRGRHTTTYRALIPLPSGGCVLDTPGIKGVGLFDTEEGLAEAFADVHTLAAACRFGDCRHNREPGCAVRAALRDGRLPARRLASWRKLRKELETEMYRRDVRLSRQARRPPRWGTGR